MIPTRRYVELMLVIACFLCIFIDHIELYINIYTMLIPRYGIFMVILLTGYILEKTEIWPMLYFRYKNISVYVRKTWLLKCKWYLCMALMLNSAVLRFDSMYYFVIYVLIDTGIFIIIDHLCKILGILCKQKIYGYILFFILFILLEFILENLNISTFFTKLWILPYIYPIAVLLCMIICFNSVLYLLYVYLMKHTDKIGNINKVLEG